VNRAVIVARMKEHAEPFRNGMVAVLDLGRRGRAEGTSVTNLLRQRDGRMFGAPFFRHQVGPGVATRGPLDESSVVR
jgi:hypothetical protein